VETGWEIEGDGGGLGDCYFEGGLGRHDRLEGSDTVI
jgi:hypothetical protein